MGLDRVVLALVGRYHLFGRTELVDPAVVEPDHAVAEVHDRLQIMTDQHDQPGITQELFEPGAEVLGA